MSDADKGLLFLLGFYFVAYGVLSVVFMFYLT